MDVDNSLIEKEVIAVVSGKPITELPNELFIPPDALEVLLDSFSGPLDVLLYLIRRQNIDILDIPMTLITQQYLQYISLMTERRLELAAEYLVMAAMLTEIKSRLLLPVLPMEGEDESEEDPRMALVRRLQAYEQIKYAAEQLDQLPRLHRDNFTVELTRQEDEKAKKQEPEVELATIVAAMKTLLVRQSQMVSHQISREPLSVRDRMSRVLERLQTEDRIAFSAFFTYDEGRMGVVVTLLALLELSRQFLLVLIQANHFSPIYIQATGNE